MSFFFQVLWKEAVSQTAFLKMFHMFGIFTVFEKVKIPPQNGIEQHVSTHKSTALLPVPCLPSSFSESKPELTG